MAPHQEKCLREVDPPPLRGVEGLLKWCFVADDSFGLLWSPVRSFHSHDETFFISHHRNGSSEETVEAAPRWCPPTPPTKEGTKIFNLHVACCRVATASAVIASLNYSFFTTILWIHIKFYSCYNLITDGGNHALLFYSWSSRFRLVYEYSPAPNNLKMLTGPTFICSSSVNKYFR